MKLPRVRVTTGRMMIVVAIVALAFPPARMADFYREHLHAALSHGEWEKFYALELKNVAFRVSPFGLTPTTTGDDRAIDLAGHQPAAVSCRTEAQIRACRDAPLGPRRARPARAGMNSFGRIG
jgi:hypothetical protein